MTRRFREPMVLLRTIQSSDEAYDQELGEALDRYRNSVVAGSEEDDDQEAYGL